MGGGRGRARRRGHPGGWGDFDRGKPGPGLLCVGAVSVGSPQARPVRPIGAVRASDDNVRDRADGINLARAHAARARAHTRTHARRARAPTHARTHARTHALRTCARMRTRRTRTAGGLGRAYRIDRDDVGRARDVCDGAAEAALGGGGQSGAVATRPECTDLKHVPRPYENRPVIAADFDSPGLRDEEARPPPDAVLQCEGVSLDSLRFHRIARFPPVYSSFNVRHVALAHFCNAIFD